MSVSAEIAAKLAELGAKKAATRTDREHVEQRLLVQWLRVHPVWSRIPWFAVPNAAKRGRILAARMKSEGMRAGVPDLVLPLAAGGFHGLYVELKAAVGDPWELSAGQHATLPALARQGYAVVVARGFAAARDALEAYRAGMVGPAAAAERHRARPRVPAWWLVAPDARDAGPR